MPNYEDPCARRIILRAILALYEEIVVDDQRANPAAAKPQKQPCRYVSGIMHPCRHPAYGHRQRCQRHTDTQCRRERPHGGGDHRSAGAVSAGKGLAFGIFGNQRGQIHGFVGPWKVADSAQRRHRSKDRSGDGEKGDQPPVPGEKQHQRGGGIQKLDRPRQTFVHEAQQSHPPGLFLKPAMNLSVLRKGHEGCSFRLAFAAREKGALPIEQNAFGKICMKLSQCGRMFSISPSYQQPNSPSAHQRRMS